MARKIAFGLLWLGFVLYAFLLAPPIAADTFDPIENLSIRQWGNINPLIISLFNLMGVLPLIYSCVLLMDGRGQKIRAWWFAIASFGLGAFALLPYLALREPNPNFSGKKDFLLKVLDSRWMGFALTLITIVLLVFGLSYGDWRDFIQQWQTSRFINVMSLDFCLLCLLFPFLLKDDLARRGVKNPLVFWTVALMPLFGALAYLCFRPPVVES